MKIKIGAEVFEVVEKSVKGDGMLNDGSYGYTLDGGNVIVIDKDIHESKKKVTLFHELMHAARMVFDLPSKPKSSADYEEWEHHFIGIWEQSLLMIFRDNPELKDYLLGDTK
jgi:hypothetical protein